ncbi:AAA family ATPase [Nocardia sp. NPDC004722]
MVGVAEDSPVSGSGSGDRSDRSEGALVGRGREVAVLDGFVENVAGGTAGSIVVIGEAGMGKTALLAYAERAAVRHRIRVLHASGAEFEAAVGFAVLQQLLLPVLDGGTAPAEPHRSTLAVALGFEAGAEQGLTRVRDAVVAVMRQLRRTSPVMLVIDDLHWVDSSTLAILAALLDAEIGIGFVGATRPDPSVARYFPRPDFGGTIPSSALTLGALDTHSAQALITARFPDLAIGVRDRLADAAQGNPLALLELPRSLSADQRQAAEPLPDTLPISDRLRRIFAARIGVLPIDTRKLLLATALDPAVEIATLDEAFGDRPASEIASPAIDIGIVSARGQQLVFAHPLVGAAVVDLASPEERANAHRLLGQILRDDRGDFERRAWHLACSVSGLDNGVASLLERAATIVRGRGDGPAAMRLLRRAADLSEETTERIRRLSLAAHIGAAGDVTGAMRLIDEIAALEPDLNTSLTTVVAIASVILEGEADVDRAHRLLTMAIAAYPRNTDPRDGVLLEAVGVLRWACQLGGRVELWRGYYTVLGRLDPAPPPLLALAAETSDDPARATATALRRVDELVAGLVVGGAPAHTVGVMEIAFVFDRLEVGRAALEEMVVRARESGANRAGASALLMIGGHDFMCGRWDASLAAVAQVRHFGALGGHDLPGWSGDYLTALVAAGRGDFDQATALADAMVRWAMPRRANAIVTFAHFVETLVAIGRGDFEGAFQHANAISPAGEFSPHIFIALDVILDLVESAVHTQRLEAARAHVRAVVGYRLAELSPRLAAVSLAVQALVAEPSEATTLFERALADPIAAQWPLDHGRILLLYGTHLRRHNAVAASRAPLRRAMGIFEELGASSWVVRAQEELSATNATRLSTSSEEAAGRLTPQERRIAELAATGLSNKRIAERLDLSPRTVGNHLYQVYAKLSVANRAGLRDALGA